MKTLCLLFAVLCLVTWTQARGAEVEENLTAQDGEVDIAGDNGDVQLTLNTDDFESFTLKTLTLGHPRVKRHSCVCRRICAARQVRKGRCSRRRRICCLY
uniref:Defensin-A4 n=1 Tax=Ornithorhynchus anatinus TaxID=9258 RepID=DEFA4_ORNAN|nr:RecName: Full=Defensin-A4; Short=DefA4; Short=OaDefA4; Flags: Precursor [Ornithorhynchus anatinus]